MKILAIESTGNVASVAISDETSVIAEITTNYKMNHSITLMPMVENILKMVDMSVNDMDYIAVSNGPGSFTGVRIGVATAKGLAHGAKKKVVSVPALDALAYNVLESNHVIAPIMDARRGEVYGCIYQNDNGLKPLSEYVAVSIDEFIKMIKLTGRKAVFLGDGCSVHHDRIVGEGFEIAPRHLLLQRGASVASLAIELAKAGKFVHHGELEIIYLRKPQAEREYEERNNI